MNDKTSIFLDIAPELSDSEGALRLRDRFLHDENAPLTLRLDGEGLSLQADGQVLRGDFVKMLPRVKPGMPAHEMLVKTAKIKNAEGTLTAVDATAGLGEDSILLAAAVKTEWELTDLWFYLGEVFVNNGPIFLGGITILWNLTRLVGYQTGIPPREGRFERVIHVALLVAAAMGLVFLLQMISLRETVFMVTAIMWLSYLAMGALQLLLYTALWIRAILRRIGDRRRAEAERLEEERLAWEGYLS
jgi:hypothetical protein